jgi:ADP-heptose:LPS heptosyltransferase
LKILIIRFSSIGDIVLTTPVVRALKKQLKNAEIHFLVKKQFAGIVENNPYIDKVFTIQQRSAEVTGELKNEKYDYVIDLHRNLRSMQVKLGLKAKSFSFDKLNYRKWLLVNLKLNKLPALHIVDRYMETVKELGVTNDMQGLDYFIPAAAEVDVKMLPPDFRGGYNALVLGGTYFTKQIPLAKLEEIISASEKPLVLLGGKAELKQAEVLEATFKEKVFNASGKLTLDQSASLVKQADKVITSDTGLMHIAAAFKKDIISLWGNTVPEFGMGPYLPGKNSKILEVKNLSCRPCSKLGHKKCPKGHFKCMREIKIGGLFSE